MPGNPKPTKHPLHPLHHPSSAPPLDKPTLDNHLVTRMVEVVDFVQMLYHHLLGNVLHDWAHSLITKDPGLIFIGLR